MARVSGEYGRKVPVLTETAVVPLGHVSCKKIVPSVKVPRKIVALPDVTLDVALPDVALPDVALPDVALPDVALPDVFGDPIMQ